MRCTATGHLKSELVRCWVRAAELALRRRSIAAESVHFAEILVTKPQPHSILRRSTISTLRGELKVPSSGHWILNHFRSGGKDTVMAWLLWLTKLVSVPDDPEL